MVGAIAQTTPMALAGQMVQITPMDLAGQMAQTGPTAPTALTDHHIKTTAVWVPTRDAGATPVQAMCMT